MYVILQSSMQTRGWCCTILILVRMNQTVSNLDFECSEQHGGAQLSDTLNEAWCLSVLRAMVEFSHLVCPLRVRQIGNPRCSVASLFG